jgi:hypothetical protein
MRASAQSFSFPESVVPDRPSREDVRPPISLLTANRWASPAHLLFSGQGRRRLKPE